MSEPTPVPGPDPAAQPGVAAQPGTEAAPGTQVAPGTEVAPGALGLLRMTIEGRRAPALFVTGWLATILGGGTGAVGLMAGGGAALLLISVGLALLTVGLVLLGGSQSVERAAAGLAWAGPSPILVFAVAITATLLTAILVAVPMGLLGVRLEIGRAHV